MSKDRVRVKVPATTANMGPAFDCMGMAMEIWNTVDAEVSQRPYVTVEGLGQEMLPKGRENVVYQAAELLYQEMGMQMPPLHFHLTNEIPMRRGLGSSASAIIGGLMAANVLAGEPLRKEDIFPLTLQLEHHPDNLAPCLMGGCQIVVIEGGKPWARSVPFPDNLGIVLFIPDLEIPTPAARAVLPQHVPLRDAVYNMGRVALMVNALATGRLDDLRVATDDRLHQPARTQLLPAMPHLFKAALDGGAKGVFLSGSGSTIMALTMGHEATVGYEMAEAARRCQLAGQVKITRPTLSGAHLVEE